MNNKKLVGEEYLCNSLTKVIEELKNEMKNKDRDDSHFFNVIKKEFDILYSTFFGNKYYKMSPDYKGKGQYDEVLAADKCAFNKLSYLVEKTHGLVNNNQKSDITIREYLKMMSTLPRCYDNIKERSKFKELLEDFYYCVDSYVTQFNKQNKKSENTKDSKTSTIKEEDYLCETLEECIKKFREGKKSNIDNTKLEQDCKLGLANFFKRLNNKKCPETILEKDDVLASRINDVDNKACEILKNKKDKIEKTDLSIIQCAQILSVISKLYDGLNHRKKLRELLKDFYYIFDSLV